MLSLAFLASCDSASTIVQLNSEPNPDAAIVEVVSGDDQEGEVAAYLADPITVEVRDSTTGMVLEGVELEWSFQQGGGASGGRGQAVQTVVMATDSRGRASMYWQLGTQAGNQSASVEITGYADIGPSGPAAAPPADRGWRKADFSARGHPSSPSNVSVSPSSVSLAVGDSVQLTGEVSDKYGNVMESP
ncbi:MAG: hypothetical protein PVH96_08010, partial [Gemmatimonadota bacterium]